MERAEELAEVEQSIARVEGLAGLIGNILDGNEGVGNVTELANSLVDAMRVLRRSMAGLDFKPGSDIERRGRQLDLQLARLDSLADSKRIEAGEGLRQMRDMMLRSQGKYLEDGGTDMGLDVEA